MAIAPLASTPAPPAGLLPPPNCQRTLDLCRIQIVQTVQKPQVTQWAPVYDGNGLFIAGDPNTYVRTATCSVCRQTWSITIDGTGHYVTPIEAAGDEDAGTD